MGGEMRGEVKRSRRAQVTLFFALGLVLLLIVAIFYLVLVRTKPSGSQNVIDISTNAQLTSYVTSCLDTAMLGELGRLGRSGGLPADASYPRATVGSGLTARTVLYGITRNRDCVKPSNGEAPNGDILESCTTPLKILPYAYEISQYPDWGIKMSDTTLDRDGESFQPFQDGYFGDVNFPAVCSRNGPNKAGCPDFLYPDYPGTAGPATQDDLNTAIASQVQSCADAEAFSNALGQDVTVEPPVASVYFTQTNVIANLTYKITLRGRTATTQTGLFTRRYDVRYLPIAEFAFNLAREDTRNVTFNMTRDYRDLPSYRDGFTVEKVRSVVVTDKTGLRPAIGNTDQVTVRDSKSQLEGQVYTFTFLVEHRWPMLDWFDHFPSDLAAVIANPSRYAADPDDGPVYIIPSGMKWQPSDQPVAISACREIGLPCDSESFDADGNQNSAR